MSEPDIDQDLPEQPLQAPEASPETTPPVEQPKEPAAPDPKDLGKTLRYNMERINKEAEAKAKATPAKEQAPANDGKGRDDKGRFVKPPEQKDPKLAQKPAEQSEPAKPGAVPKKDVAPGTWRADAKAEWEKTPPAVRAEALRRESELTQAVAKRDQQITQINQAYGGIERLIGSRRAGWTADHGSVEVAMGKLLAMNDLAASDPNAFLARYLNFPDVASRLDLQKVFGNAAPQGADLNQHPALQSAMQEISGLKQQLSGFLNQHQQTQAASTEQQVAAFIEAKDEQGNPKRPHFDAVREDVFNLIPALKPTMPGASVEQVMDRAYTIAIHSNQSVAGEVRQMEEQRIREGIEKQQRLERAKLANKSGLPNAPQGEHSSGEQVNPKDLRATLKRNLALARQGETPRI
jgi:hypothetical protein